MNSADRFEFDQVRRDQTRVHDLVSQLDRRIDLLARRFDEPTAIAAPTPAPRPVVPQRSWYEEAPQVVLRPPDIVAQPQPAPPPLPVRQNPPAPAPEPLELRLGTYWMARIGIVILLTGLVFLGNYAYHRIVPMLGAAGKLALLALAGVALGGLGAWLERSRESTRNFGRVLLAGGAATLYYTVYAAHFVTALRVIESPLLGGSLLLALTGAFIAYADRRRSEAVAVPAVLLAYYTSSINAVGGFTLFSNLLLTATAVFFLVRHRWTRLSFASLIGTYGSYAFFRLSHGADVAGLVSEIFFLAGYWVIFTSAVFLAAPAAMRGRDRVTFLTLNNAAFFIFAAQHFEVVRPDAFWLLTLGFGLILLGLAALAARLRNEERALDGAYLVQGLLLATLGLVAKLTGPQLSVMLAVESAALLTAANRRHGWIWQMAAGLCAVGACGCAVEALLLHRAAPFALGLPVAALLLIDAWWIKRVLRAGKQFCQRAACFAILAFIVVAALIDQTTPMPWQPTAFALVACGGLSALRIRLREAALPAQAFLGIGVGSFLAQFAHARPELWWTGMPVMLIALGLMHWWQHQRVVALSNETRGLAQLGCAFGVVAMLACDLHNFCPGDRWLWATSAAALVTLIYGMMTRSWALALVGQLFTAFACASFVQDVWFDRPAWAAALAPIANLVLTSFLLRRAKNLLPAASGVSVPVLAELYRLTAFAFLAVWSFTYVPPEWRMAFFAGTGAGQMLFGALAHRPRRVLLGTAYAGIALAIFWSRLGADPRVIELLAIISVPAVLRLAKFLTGEPPLPFELRATIVAAAMASVWLWVTQWTQLHASPNQLTIAWTVLALALLTAGLGLRERTYRLGGFGVLILALGRLFVIDVWGFDPLFRIASFLSLGVGLLALSFVYNRFAETLRRWL